MDKSWVHTCIPPSVHALSFIKPASGGSHALLVQLILKVIEFFVAVVIMAVNGWSVRWATRVQDIFTYAKLICIAILVVIGIIEIARGRTAVINTIISTRSNMLGKYLLLSSS